MQNYIQSVNEDDQTTDDCIYMKVVLEFLADSATTSTPSQLVEHGWSICYDLIRSGHQEQFLTGNGVKMALDEFRNEDDRAVLRKSVADVLYHVADMRSEHVINPDHLDLLLEALTSPIQTVSYLSSKILCRLLYRGPRHWCLEAPTKDDVILRLRGAIKEWSLDYDMKIKIDDFTTQREYLLSYQQMLQEMAVWELGYLVHHYISLSKTIKFSHFDAAFSSALGSRPPGCGIESHRCLCLLDVLSINERLLGSTSPVSPGSRLNKAITH